MITNGRHVMMKRRCGRWLGTIGLCAVLAAPALGAVLPDSERLGHAKDLIGDEQWQPAIRELKAAAADPAEASQDEVLFWLAHCQNQTRDAAAAIETIQRLERGYPRSPWLKPARSLRIEIAQRLRRNDVLWFTAAPPPPAAPPTPPAPPAARTPPPAATSAVPPTPPAPPVPPDPWMPERFMPDTDLRIQALGSLMQTDAVRVIPMLREIALTGHDADEARRALFMLAQSHRPEARATVVEMATSGPELVRVAAVRALGGLGGPAVSSELLRVYATANERVKYQVVLSLGQRDAVPALMHIAQSETDARLRDAAIVRLGEAGGRAELAQLYARQRASAADMKSPIIAGLFNARADVELIRLADRETDPAAKEEILARLRLLGTPAARAYLAARPR